LSCTLGTSTPSKIAFHGPANLLAQKFGNFSRQSQSGRHAGYVDEKPLRVQITTAGQNTFCAIWWNPCGDFPKLEPGKLFLCDIPLSFLTYYFFTLGTYDPEGV